MWCARRLRRQPGEPPPPEAILWPTNANCQSRALTDYTISYGQSRTIPRPKKLAKSGGQWKNTAESTRGGKSPRAAAAGTKARQHHPCLRPGLEGRRGPCQPYNTHSAHSPPPAVRRPGHRSTPNAQQRGTHQGARSATPTKNENARGPSTVGTNVRHGTFAARSAPDYDEPRQEPDNARDPTSTPVPPTRAPRHPEGAPQRTQRITRYVGSGGERETPRTQLAPADRRAAKEPRNECARDAKINQPDNYSWTDQSKYKKSPGRVQNRTQGHSKAETVDPVSGPEATY